MAHEKESKAEGKQVENLKGIEDKDEEMGEEWSDVEGGEAEPRTPPRKAKTKKRTQS